MGNRNYIKIQMDICDEKYAKALGKRLSELSDRLDVLTYLCDEECDVLITDKDDIYSKNSTPYVLILNDDDYISPVNIILEKVVEIYKMHSGKHFYNETPNGLKTVFFTSIYGGSGTTSISLMFARLLAERDYKTILISLDTRHDYKWYVTQITEPLKPQKQLEYMLMRDEAMIINEYIYEDLYKVKYLELSDDSLLEKLVGIIENSRLFDVVVVDWNKYSRPIIANNIVKILNYEDARINFEKEINGQITVYNKAPGKSILEDKICVVKDFESFKISPVGEEKIDISMHGSFCQCIDILVKRCIDEWNK